MSRSTGRPWTKPETELAAQKRAQGETYSDIARMLGRTVFSVANKLIKREGPNIEVTAYPGVARCKCGLTRDESHQTCDLARTAPEHVARFMRSPSE